jgi:hypothetical protein
MDDLIKYLVSLEMLFVGFLIGWFLPRGDFLKAFQRGFLSSLQRFFK